MDNRKIAWITLIIWTIILIGFSIIFFSGNNAEEWGVNRIKRVVSAILFGIGFLSFFIIQFKRRKNKKDERTFLIELKASRLSMIIVLLYVYVSSVVLYIIYETKLLMPVSWMWFLAYSTICITFIVNSGLHLWFEKKVEGYGEY